MIGQIEQALAGFVGPEQPRDGDCLVVAPLVTGRLHEAGMTMARDITVWGWLDHEGQVIGFVHQASAVGTFVIDFTARQFNPELPARWVVASLAYRLKLAQAAGVQAVTVTDASR